MSYECDNLDGFLADDLPTEGAARFELHFCECAACSDAVEQQRWIDVLLRSPLREELEVPSAGVAESLRVALRRRRRVRLIVGGLAAAAVVVLAAGWTVLTARQADHSTIAVAEVVSKPSPDPVTERGMEQPRAEFVGGPDVIVVPVKTSHPNVTVVRVYPTYQQNFAVHAQAKQPATGGSFDRPLDFDDLNGG